MTYIESVDHYLKGIDHVSPGNCLSCLECNPDGIDAETFEQDHPDEGGFSWAQCDGCGSTFGGDRYAGHGTIKGELIHLDLCVDCLMYLANGDEPDTPWYRTPYARQEAQRIGQ